MDNVGLIGYGAMGTAFAERLRLSSGIDPVVYDIDESACRRAVSNGLAVVSSAAELGARCNVIDIIVRTDEEMVAATIGADGAVRTASPGTVLLLHSSTLPATTFEIARVAAERGLKVADACASATPEHVREGKLLFLLGATPELAEQVRPHLLRMAYEVRHMGPLGAGNVAKLVKNVVNASERLVLWEALQIGEAAGISYIDLLEMMRFASSGHVPVVERWEHAFDPSGADLLPSCGTNLYNKDVPLAAELARSYGLATPVIEQLATSAAQLVKLNEGREWAGG